MNLAIITPIQVELDAVLAKVPAYKEEILEGIRYLHVPFKGLHHSFNLVLQLGGAKNENTALATEKVVRNFMPQAIILCGVAGGVKDVGIGDVVIGNKYYGYDFGKVTSDGFKTRPESGYYSKHLLATAQSVAASAAWRNRCRNNQPCKVIFGAIAAANKVVAATDSEEYRRLKDDFNDTTAVEMEAVGFSQAMHFYPAIPHINIRGISDLLDGKSHADAGGSQELAADNMAAFVLELVYQLKIDHPHEQAPSKFFAPTQSGTMKNVVTSSTISAQGNVHIGDTVNHHYPGNAQPTAMNIVQEQKKAITKLVSQARIEKALEQLSALGTTQDEDFNLEVVSLSQRWAKLQKESRLGLLSTSESTQQNNQIVMALLNLLNQV
ncbi:MAG: 5'-methylthioadenosine/S-adenosylhomocysteine nucleosidase [Saprospiraceae bacterium]|nr:5'-methylthioadenosine/S-adenosylhomocysteine nucleosidase [Saprospiraceae bacterium]